MLWKLDYGHFPIRILFFFQTNITSLIQFRMFFSNSENEVWMELKPDSCCCKNLKDYYSRKCTLNQSNEKVLHFFRNKWHEKCSNFKVYIWFLGGLSLHLNHLIVERMSTPYWQFGTLPIGIFLSNLVSGQLETSLMTSYCHFWNLSTFGDSRAVWVFWPKLGVFRKSKFSRWRSDGASMRLGVLGSQISRLYDGTIFGGGATDLRGSHGLSKKLKLKNFSAHLRWLKGYLAFTDFIKNQSIGAA